MRWSHVSAEEWEALRKRHEAGNPTRPLDERPPVTEYELVLWAAFWRLRHSTPSSGMGGVNGIPISEINAYIALTQEEDRNFFSEVIYSLDREYVTLVHAKSKESDKDGRSSRRNSRKK